MKSITYREIEGRGIGWYGLLAVLGLFLAVGLGAFIYIEHFSTRVHLNIS